MGRRSKLVNTAIDEIKSQPRRPRKKRDPKPIPLGLKTGQLVIITSEHQMKGKRFGIVMEACKHDGGIIVRLSDDGQIAKYYCVRPELGDTIERLNNSANGNNQTTEGI